MTFSEIAKTLGIENYPAKMSELFENPDTKFLDPACKTGVFLREIAKRLGILKSTVNHYLYAEEGERFKHDHDYRWYISEMYVGEDVECDKDEKREYEDPDELEIIDLNDLFI